MSHQNPLITTGVPGLDALLYGTISPGALVFVIGPPGAGKTILGSQIIFTAARAGEHTLILSTYSESHEKLLQHLQPLAFFDLDLIGSRVQLLSVRSLNGKTAVEISNALIHAIRESGARLVLIDGFQGLLSLVDPPEHTRLLLSMIAGQLGYVGTTVIATFAGEAHDRSLSPMLTAADVIIGLNYSVEGLQHLRTIEIVKQRGRAQLAGLHPFRIEQQGIVVMPRIEIYPQAITGPRPSGRAPFGLPELDQLLMGGLTAGTTTLLAGAAGVGKTILSLHWATYQAQSDASSVYVTFREHSEQLLEKAAAFGLNLSESIQNGSLRIVRLPPAALDPDRLALQLLELFQAKNVRRVVIDNINFLTSALGTRAANYYAALVEHLYGEGVTTLSTLDIDSFHGLRLDLAESPLAVMAENVIMIQQHEAQGTLRRVLAVLRMGFSNYDRSVCELEFEDQALRVRCPAIYQ